MKTCLMATNNVKQTTHGTTHILYQYQSDPSTQTQASVPVQRSRSVSIDAPEICEPMQSMLTPNDRKQGRSIHGMKLHEDAQPNSKEARNLNTLYKLGQIGSTDLLDLTSEMEPATWKEFHKKFIEQSSVQTTIGYGPFVPKPPTTPNVVMESVDDFMAVSKYLGLNYCVLTCDQAIYEICHALQKKFTEKYKNVILRMGGFHILMNFWGAIGRLMSGTGLEQLMIT